MVSIPFLRLTISQNKRFLLALLSIFQPLGVVICSGIAYGFVPKYSCDAGLPSCRSSTLEPGAACCSKADNYGWRYLMFTLGAISLFVFLLRFVIFTFQESPKYLVGKGRDEEAIKVLHNVAKVNGYVCQLSIEDLKALEANDPINSTPDGDEAAASAKIDDPNGSLDPGTSTILQSIKFEFYRIKILFATSDLTRLTILVWIIYAFDYWAFSVAGKFFLVLRLLTFPLTLSHQVHFCPPSFFVRTLRSTSQFLKPTETM